MTIWLIGSGLMSQAYASVLNTKGLRLEVIGRGVTSARAFETATGCSVHTGGLSGFLATAPAPAEAAIVSVGVEALAETTAQLIQHGVRRILVEKPAALHLEELLQLQAAARAQGSEVLIGYNRRSFASVLRLKELLAEDGGAVSCSFEFTEWGHEIETLVKAPGVKERWALSNSSHVIDLAFHLIGAPAELHAITRGSLPWHTDAAAFVGCGVSQRGVPFSYQANWDAPGRWGVEVLSSQRRFILRPMEALQVMRRGGVAVEAVPLDDALDKQFKPGLHRQVSDFLSGRPGALCSLAELIAVWPAFCHIAGYQP